MCPDLFVSSNNQRRSALISSKNQRLAQERVVGLQYMADFISVEEEKELLAAIDREHWITDLKRRVQHYGWRYDYKARSIDYSMFLGPLPDWSIFLASKLYQTGHMPAVPDQLIINEYEPGQGIANHVDCEPCFGSTIISISLSSTCIMDLINLETREKIEMVLEPRSLIVIADEARYDWSHGIPARKVDNIYGIKTERARRISLTFRNVVIQ